MSQSLSQSISHSLSQIRSRISLALLARPVTTPLNESSGIASGSLIHSNHPSSIIHHPSSASDQSYIEGVLLVAVSKTQSPEAILAAFDAGHRHFGENYVQV